MTMQPRGQLRAWLPFRAQVFSDDFRAMFAGQDVKVGEKKTIRMQYEIHDYDGSCQMVEDPIDISVAVYERSKYKWLFMDFKLLHEYWTGGIYKSAPDTCVMIMHEKGPKPFGLPYTKRRANQPDVSSKDLEVMRDKNWVYPKEVTVQLMVDNVLVGQPVRTEFMQRDNKVWLLDMDSLDTAGYNLHELHDCGYSIRSDDEVVKMASTKPAPMYPNPQELEGPLYRLAQTGDTEWVDGALATGANNNPNNASPAPMGSPPAGEVSDEAGGGGAGAVADGVNMPTPVEPAQDGGTAAAAAAAAGEAEVDELVNGVLPATQVLQPVLPEVEAPAAAAEEAAEPAAAAVAGQQEEQQEEVAEGAQAAQGSEQQGGGRGKRARMPSEKATSLTGNKRPRGAAAAAAAAAEEAISAGTGGAVAAAADSKKSAGRGKEGAAAAAVSENEVSEQGPRKRTRGSAAAAAAPKEHHWPRFMDFTDTARPGGDTSNEPCIFCKKRISWDHNQLYLCENNCGWGAHHACLGLTEPLPDSDNYFCCLGCQKEFNAKHGKDSGQVAAEPATADDAAAAAPATRRGGRGAKAGAASAAAQPAAAAADTDVEMVVVEEDQVEEAAGKVGPGTSKTPGPTGKKGKAGKQPPGSAPAKVAPAAAAAEEPEAEAAAAAVGSTEPAKRRPGRPRKHPISPALASGGQEAKDNAGGEAMAAEDVAAETTKAATGARAQQPAGGAPAPAAGPSKLTDPLQKQQQLLATVLTNAQAVAGPSIHQPLAMIIPAKPASLAAAVPVVLPKVEYDPSGSNVPRSSRLKVMDGLATLLIHLGLAHAVPALFKVFESEDTTPEGQKQATYHYQWVQFYWQQRDEQGLLNVLRTKYKLPV